MIRLTDRQLQIVMTAAASLKDCRQRGCDAHQPMLLCDYEAPAAHAPDRECGRRADEAHSGPGHQSEVERQDSDPAVNHETIAEAIGEAARNQIEGGSIEGPALCERPDDVIEGPGRGVLMRDVIHLVGDGVRMREIIVALILPIRGRLDTPCSPCARKPRGIDDGVDRDVADMDALRPQILRKALREDALGRLCRREGRAHRDSAE